MQAALLAGLPQAPSLYDPFRRPGRRARAPQRGAAGDARRTATITLRPATSAALARHEPAPEARAGSTRRIREPYFFSYVRDQLIATYGAETVRSGGLRVYTTIDPRVPARGARRRSRTRCT